MPVNYHWVMEQELSRVSSLPVRPSLLLHSCCGPCSSYVLEVLPRYFDVTVFYYNPNIFPQEEYKRRQAEQKRLITKMSLLSPVRWMEAPYQPERFHTATAGLEGEPEGGARCARCFELRLFEAARAAKEGAFAYFTTTLSVSPHKNAALLNEIGEQAAKQFGVLYLYADFKKKGGYQRSLVLSAEHGLYRQRYCGCEYSLQR